MPADNTVLCDMDGVLADFIGGLARISPAHSRASSTRDAPTDGKIDRYFGYDTPGELWQNVDSYGRRFWSELEPLPWAYSLMEYLCSLPVDFAICTSPSRNPVCAAGKLVWLKRFFNHDFRDFVITPRKHLLASGSNFLIDDCDQNIQRFTRASGFACTWPMPWNLQRDHFSVDGSAQLAYLRTRLDRWIEGQL